MSRRRRVRDPFDTRPDSYRHYPQAAEYPRYRQTPLATDFNRRDPILHLDIRRLIETTDLIASNDPDLPLIDGNETGTVIETVTVTATGIVTVNATAIVIIHRQGLSGHPHLDPIRFPQIV